MIDIMCLANSFEHGRRCIAGVRVDTNEWVRPVSDTPDGMFSHNLVAVDGSPIQALHIVRVPLDRPSPQHHQPENWTVRPDGWTRVRIVDRSEALELLEPVVSRGRGILGTERDRLLMDEIRVRREHASLALIAVSRPEFLIEHMNGARRIRCAFRHAGVGYDLPVTADRNLLHEYGLPDEGGYHPSARDWYFTISLTEPRNGACYKVVAGAIPMRVASQPILDQPTTGEGTAAAPEPRTCNGLSDELLGFARLFAARTGSALQEEQRREAITNASYVLTYTCKAYLAAQHPLLVIASTDGGLHPPGLSWALGSEPSLEDLPEQLAPMAAVRRCCYLIGDDELPFPDLLRILDAPLETLKGDIFVEEQELVNVIKTVFDATNTILKLLERDPPQLWGRHHQTVVALAERPQPVEKLVAERVATAEEKWFTIQEQGQIDIVRDQVEMYPPGWTEWEVPCPVCGSHALMSGELSIAEYGILATAIWCNVCTLRLDTAEQLEIAGISDSIRRRDLITEEWS